MQLTKTKELANSEHAKTSHLISVFDEAMKAKAAIEAASAAVAKVRSTVGEGNAQVEKVQQDMSAASAVFSREHLSLSKNFNKLPHILEHVRENTANNLNTLFSEENPAEYEVRTKLTANLPQIARPGQERDAANTWGTSKYTYELGTLTVAYLALAEGNAVGRINPLSPVHQKVLLSKFGSDVAKQPGPDNVSKFFNSDRDTLTMIHTGFLWGGHRFQLPQKEFGPHDASSFVQFVEFGNSLDSKVGHTTGDLYRTWLWNHNEASREIVTSNHTEWHNTSDGQLTHLYDAVEPGQEKVGDVQVVVRGVTADKPLGGGGSMGIVTALKGNTVDILECNRDMPNLEGMGIGTVPRGAADNQAVVYLRLKESAAAEAEADPAVDEGVLDIPSLISETDTYMMGHLEELIPVFSEA